ncbi:MAG: TetR/AcrR family transcriptional regulator [Pseudomonadales bacterium]|nr:TetR/AcrR family transcriptional regulator [Pseudomonadales bacterium]
MPEQTRQSRKLSAKPKARAQKSTPHPRSRQTKATPNRKAQTRISSDERRESILDAARTVFVDHGFSGARTKDIAAEAGINEALIYRHFASKEELFDAAVIEPLERWMTEYHHLGREISAATSAETQMELLTRTGSAFMREMETIFPLLGLALFGSGDYGRDFYVRRVMPVLDMWAERTRVSLPKGARGARLDPRFMASVGTAVAFFMVADAHFRNAPFDNAEAGRQLAELMLPMFERTSGR